MSTLGLSVILSGCGKQQEGPVRHSISGAVTLDSKPLETGSILFVDPEGQHQSYFASVKDGSYQVDIESGTWNVQVTATREAKDKKIPNAEGTGMIPAQEQYLPARYNEKTELRITVEPGQKNEFPFELSSK